MAGARAGIAAVATRDGIVHQAILWLVWATFVLSSVVFSEPAPVDLAMFGLIALLPAAGLVEIVPALAVYIALWAIAAAGGLVAATMSPNLASSVTFTAVSIYLYVASFVLAGFVARAPVRHTELILRGWLVAAVIAALAAFTGYFRLLPGAYELFTKFDRAAGTFKDPNVFGPFLVAPFLYALHLVLVRPWRAAALPMAAAGLLALANLLSFSRGAWINLLLALGIYGVLAYAFAPAKDQRQRIVAIVLGGLGVAAVGALAIAQDERMAAFLSERASMTQSYDVGPAGRFGGQEKATRLLLDNPFGIGATVFASEYHHEEVHNVFLSMFLNAGWVGGLAYALVVIVTMLVGAMHLNERTAARPLFLVAYAAFVATALEGIIIDSDHWRSFYFLMAMVWGLAFSPNHGPCPHLPRRAERRA